MHGDNQQLWQAIDQFSLDDLGAADPFTVRLARENRWTRSHAQRVVHEYKRFVFLAVTSDHCVTPSDAVDQVWHLHLTYSGSYWNKFCPKVLGMALHHGPSRGGRADLRKHKRDYERTLESYWYGFGEFAPADIWPPAAQRFREGQCVRVHTADHWIIRKPMRWLYRLAGQRPARPPIGTLALVSGACATAALGCQALGLPDPLDLAGSTFIGFHLVLWGVTLTIAHVVQHALRQTPVAATTPELTPAEVAYLAGGARFAVDTAVADLVARGKLSADAKGLYLTPLESPAADAPALERAICQCAERAGRIAPSMLRADAPCLARGISDRLSDLGLVDPPASLVPFALALVAPGVGILKAFVGVSRHKPVGVLFVLCTIGIFVALALHWPRRGLTDSGRTRLETLRQIHEPLEAAGASAETVAAGLLPLAIALFGVSLLEGSEYASLSSLFRTEGAGSTSDGGGGCGGGGCGGGCGGCGGE